MGPSLRHIQTRTILESSSNGHRRDGFMGPPKSLQPLIGCFNRYLVWLACIIWELGKIEREQGDDRRGTR
jgi:hypothetical protein